MMNAQRLAVVKIVPNSMKSKKLRKTTMSGEYKKIAKKTCRVVKYPMESTSAVASSRSALFSPDFTGSAKALEACRRARGRLATFRDRKSTRLNSSHANISYAVFCLKKKKINRGFQFS